MLVDYGIPLTTILIRNHTIAMFYGDFHFTYKLSSRTGYITLL